MLAGIKQALIHFFFNLACTHSWLVEKSYIHLTVMALNGVIVALDSESQVQIQPQARYLYHIIWQFKIIIFHGASCHPRVQMGPSKVRGNLIKCWEVNCDGQE